MARPTVRQLRADVEELLRIAPVFERYRELEKQIKSSMEKLKHDECAIEGLGRVFISKSERVTVSPELAARILGTLMAERVTVIKKSVPTSVLKGFVDAGEISEAQRDDLMKHAEKKSVVNLYVRPLK